MADLEQKASKWIGFIIKGMIIFAIIGCITLFISVQFITKSINEISNPSSSATATSTTTTQTSK